MPESAYYKFKRPYPISKDRAVSGRDFRRFQAQVDYTLLPAQEINLNLNQRPPEVDRASFDGGLWPSEDGRKPSVEVTTSGIRRVNHPRITPKASSEGGYPVPDSDCFGGCVVSYDYLNGESWSTRTNPVTRKRRGTPPKAVTSGGVGRRQ